MIKIKRLLKSWIRKIFYPVIAGEIRNLQSKADEIIWANVYHDTINGISWLKNLSVSPGRWAANYSMLYALVRVLNESRPKRILEFGLGESSKIISAYKSAMPFNCDYVVVEHDKMWADNFSSRFNNFSGEIIFKKLIKKKYYDYEINAYEIDDFNSLTNFDFYIIDGPFGSSGYSRMEIFEIVKHINPNSSCLILIDDLNRSGEEEMVRKLEATLKDIHKYSIKYLSGLKKQAIITLGSNSKFPSF